MTNLQKLFNDDRAIELPINIVVMLVVGMVALAALVAIIPPPTKNMSVNIIESGEQSATPSPGNTIIVDSTVANSPFDIGVEISVSDPDGYPVRAANVVLRGLGGVATGTTDDHGNCSLSTASSGSSVSLGPNQNEGTMDLTISTDGFYDFEKTDAVMIVRTS
ncbi:carboxypeptidase regulatory-like domain-containing protein [Methanolobus mangrovi]|uniref:Carboxypeptidase regulatory-like domain-containing protein n=1 Tax=Methanolobus mangrovi TaxID=3072977 RepID=A0AA51UF58_9EURY|nr:carboxypeptidase regulatory-like domain-containing protein [Methanolobus mangrovi]WMW21819.1 carboxypeptidase regulatory-like domain-containing protein [Methanolobus mangrovi]